MKREIPKCKKFTGYKPCKPGYDCLEQGCRDMDPIGIKILIVNLDAMGDVLMTTAQLAGLKRKFPESTVYWVTLKAATPLLLNNPLIDKVLPFDYETDLILSQMEFDYVMNVDKSLRSGALALKIKSRFKLGFGINEDGQIIALNEGAEYNYRLGMDDHLKFRINKRTGQDYLSETFELDYDNDDYIFCLTEEEKKFTENYKRTVGITPQDKIIGFNTGCSNLYPNKKMTIEQHVYLIDRLLKNGNYKIMLLGGPEDESRNAEIDSHFPDRIISTPTNEGLRRGACYESIPEVIVTGDSFGMHLAIALKKHVIAWFGLSCWEEIELYGRGIKLYPEKLECSPCWKKRCPFDLECIKMIDMERILNEVDSYFSEKK